jgi:ADP-ribosyl-[dinitrogen reductase] hydrolase
MYDSELEYALKAARAAADLLRPGFHAGFKRDLDADAERTIQPILASRFSSYGYRGEELGLVSSPRDKEKHLWLVDPQDGTTAAENGYRGAAVSIALLRDGLPVLGVVYAYCAPDDLGDLFWWAEGLDAVHRNGTVVKRVWPKEPSDANTVLISRGADRNAEANAEVVAPMRFRTIPGIAYRLALVASGDGDVAVSLNSPTGWDVAGGHALLRGAGGDLFDGRGHPVIYDRSGSAAESPICYGGTRALVEPLLTRKWDKVLKQPAGPSAADLLVYLTPGQTIRDAGILSRAQGCMLGQLAGDALGSLVEFRPAEEITKRYPDGPRRLENGGTWNTIAGQPTDDSELALSLARSIVRSGRYDDEAAATAYSRWIDSHPFDVGRATDAALSAGSRALREQRQVASAARDAALNDTQANGALMRIAPLGIFGSFLPPVELFKLARIDAGLTHPHGICRAANGLFATAIAFAIRTGLGAAATYEYALSVGRSEAVARRVLEALQNAKERTPEDFIQHAGWVLIAFQNAFHQLLRARNLEDGIVNTVRLGGDTDTNAAIAGALLGAVHGREGVPRQWRDRVLTCRPIPVLPAVQNPRPAAYWPVDALELAESLLVKGLRVAGPDQDALDTNIEYPKNRVSTVEITINPPLIWDGIDRVEPRAHTLDSREGEIAQGLISFLPRLERIKLEKHQPVTELTTDGVFHITMPEPSKDLSDFFSFVFESFGLGPYSESPVRLWLAQPDFVERAQFPQLRIVLGWMQRGERWCDGFWDDILHDGSLIRVLRRVSSLVPDSRHFSSRPRRPPRKRG